MTGILKSLFFNYALVDLLSGKSLSHFWSNGFTLGILFVIQLISGVLLSMYYSPPAFEKVIYITNESGFGEMIRNGHSVMVTFIFICLFLHLFRGFYYKSFFLVPVWGTGVVLLLLFIITAFLGYSLVWSQMSFWAVTVITNLVTVVPVFGVKLVLFVWGGFSVGEPTLIRFYSLHFLLPFVILFLILLHILVLHFIHSASPIGLKAEGMKFFPNFVWKDLVYFLGLFSLLLISLGWFFIFFLEEDFFLSANQLIAPEHIVPEWYFLPFYAVLRAVPNKMGGVLLMMGVLGMAFSLAFKNKQSNSLGWKMLIYWLLFLFLILFWIGSLPVIVPFDSVGQLITVLFFFVFLLLFVF